MFSICSSRVEVSIDEKLQGSHVQNVPYKCSSYIYLSRIHGSGDRDSQVSHKEKDQIVNDNSKCVSREFMKSLNQNHKAYIYKMVLLNGCDMPNHVYWLLKYLFTMFVILI